MKTTLNISILVDAYNSTLNKLSKSDLLKIDTQLMGNDIKDYYGCNFDKEDAVTHLSLSTHNTDSYIISIVASAIKIVNANKTLELQRALNLFI